MLAVNMSSRAKGWVGPFQRYSLHMHSHQKKAGRKTGGDTEGQERTQRNREVAKREKSDIRNSKYR